MVSNNTHALVLTLLLVVGAQFLDDHKCSQFIDKTRPQTPPSLRWCQVIKTLNVDCVCRFVTTQMEAMTSMEKVVYVA
ncbi:hypothetical protein SADUNF_Sadunf09G0038000 [Salix dunnii]|uniref:Bifunctional inhibitor/plant lipid transfer protein/seed storage helical domain-containing protein n=1 Tax=Salix dunnii TaxID=1413687 RepID=A0A835JWR6_9ROSI|nr:hypothetical protein SADUNF_Sadunf09G0038000 [Salix dunnii]